MGCVACRRSLETGQSFSEHYLPAYNFRETERGTEYKRDVEKSVGGENKTIPFQSSPFFFTQPEREIKEKT